MIEFKFHNTKVVYDEKKDSYKIYSNVTGGLIAKVDRDFIKKETDCMRKIRYINIYRKIYKKLGKEFNTEGLYDNML